MNSNPLESLSNPLIKDDDDESSNYTSYSSCSLDEKHTRIIHDAKMIFGSEIDIENIDWKKLEKENEKGIFSPFENANWKIKDEFIVSYIQERFHLFEVFVCHPYYKCEEDRKLYLRIKDIGEIAFKDEIEDIFSKNPEFVNEHNQIRELLNQDFEDLYLTVVPHIAIQNF